jgi:hypothetical protein
MLERLDWSECPQIVSLLLQDLIHEFSERFTFLKKYDSLFSLVFSPLNFPVDQLNAVQLTGSEHLADAECELTCSHLWQLSICVKMKAKLDFGIRGLQEVSFYTSRFF